MDFKQIFSCVGTLIIIFFISNCKTQKEEEIVTFKDIAPIIHQKCAICHRPGEAGPFSLITYQEIKSHANKIRFSLESGFMPPWPADTNYTRFSNELILTLPEKNKILKWIQDGYPAGDTSKTKYNTTSVHKNFRKPDLIIPLQKPILVNGNGVDHFFIVKMPYQLEKDTFVQYVEFVPHQKKLVHHVNGHLLKYDSKRKFDYFKGLTHVEEPVENFVETYKKMGLTYTDAKDNKPTSILPVLIPNTVYYLPGFLPLRYKENIGGFYLPKNGVFFLNDIHYGPTHKSCYDSSYLRVYFAPQRPERPVYEGQMGTHGMSKIQPPLIIPPNTIKSFTTTLSIPTTISILAVNPHMHLLGQSYWAFAVTSHRDTIPLIRINKWNFNWQYYYIFKKPVIIPAGSIIVAIATYNNTTNNPFNPNHPPIEVKEGDGFHSMKTTDEMFQFFFQYMLYKPGDDTISIQP
ncbi:MAG: hypothetical protein KatS3mg027_1509 [Bacteroidia bacterium]|nr:MAG: hypothetical protein KatS3mg027_1509 [Bacteroidia bacterium]